MSAGRSPSRQGLVRTSRRGIRFPVNDPHPHVALVRRALRGSTVRGGQADLDEETSDCGDDPVGRGSHLGGGMRSSTESSYDSADSVTHDDFAAPDLQITNNVFDGSGQALQALDASPRIAPENIVAAATDASSAALHFEDGGLSVTISGNQIHNDASLALQIDDKTSSNETSDAAKTVENGNNAEAAGESVHRESLFTDAAPIDSSTDLRSDLWNSASAASGIAIDPSADALSQIPWADAPSANLQIPSFSPPAAAEKRLDDVEDSGERARDRDTPQFESSGELLETDAANVITSADLGSEYAVRCTAAGQWLEYRIDVTLGGTYNIDFRFASAEQVGGTFELQMDGASVTGPIAAATMDDWSAWRTVTKTGVSLAAGQHIVRIYFDSKGSAGAIANFNYFRLIRSDFVGALTPTPDAPSDLAVTAISASRIELTWTNTSNNGASFKVERALRGEVFTTIARCPAGSTSYSDAGLAANTKYYYRIRATNAGGESAASDVARTTTLAEVQPPPLPSSPLPDSDAVKETSDLPGLEKGVNSREGQEVSPPPIPASPPPSNGSLPGGWSTANVGPSTMPGSASYADGSFIVGGAGSDIWGKSDGFRFVYHPLDGDGQIVARIAGLQRSNLLAKGGVMMRETLVANSKHVGLLVTPLAGLRFLRRHHTGSTTTNAVKTDNRGVRAPCWLKLVRSGGTITAYRSADGENWQIVGSEAIELSASIHVGLAVTSHIVGTTNVSTFDNVSVVDAQPQSS